MARQGRVLESSAPTNLIGRDPRRPARPACAWGMRTSHNSRRGSSAPAAPTPGRERRSKPAPTASGDAASTAPGTAATLPTHRAGTGYWKTHPVTQLVQAKGVMTISGSRLATMRRPFVPMVLDNLRRTIERTAADRGVAG